jgi:hypothetical protein
VLLLVPSLDSISFLACHDLRIVLYFLLFIFEI